MEDVDVDLVGFLGGDSPVGGGEWAAARAVDGLTVARKPFTDGVKARNKFFLNLAVGHGADVQKQIGIVAGGADEQFY